MSDCKQYDIEDLKLCNKGYKYSARHINIQGLPAKYGRLITLVANLTDIDIKMQFIIICETFLNDTNFDKYAIPSYHFVKNNRSHHKQGGVGIYIMDTLQFNIRNDLSVFYEMEFEAIVVEITNLKHKLIVAEI